MKKHFLVFLVFIAFVLGCASTETVESTKISPTEIFQDYSITANRARTDVSATFRIGNASGTTVDLDAPAKVELNGKEMRESAPAFLKGTDYRYSSSNFESAQQFAYTDAAGKVYHNEISFAPVEIDGETFTISRSGTTQIPLSRPLAEDEIIYYSLVSGTRQPQTESNANVDSNSSQSYSIYTKANLSKTRREITLEVGSELKKFVPGKATLHLEVKKEIPTKEATAKGGRIIFSYESASIAVNVLN